MLGYALMNLGETISVYARLSESVDIDQTIRPEVLAISIPGRVGQFLSFVRHRVLCVGFLKRNGSVRSRFTELAGSGGWRRTEAAWFSESTRKWQRVQHVLPEREGYGSIATGGSNQRRSIGGVAERMGAWII